MSQKKDRSIILGKTYNYLTVDLYQDIKQNKQKINVTCYCGNKKQVQLNNIISGSIKSCGCMKSKIISNTNTIHGMSSFYGLYNIYAQLKGRCENIRNKDYIRYGGRGIKCMRNCFEDFYNEMKEGYKKGLTIDRIDNNSDYNKENCRWVDMKTQCNNRSNNKIIIYKGEKYTLSQLSDYLGIQRTTLSNRIKKGITIDGPIYGKVL